MNAPAPPELRSLDQILSLADGGDYLADLMQRHQDMLDELADFANTFGTSAKGSLTLKLKFTRDRFGQIEIEIEDKIDTPKPPKAKAIAWATRGGGLSTSNPAQSRMEIRDVGGSRELSPRSFAND